MWHLHKTSGAGQSDQPWTQWESRSPRLRRHGSEGRGHRWGATHGRGGRLPERRPRMPALKDEERWTGRVPGKVDRQLYARPARHHERRRPGWRGDGRHDRAPPGLPCLAGPPRQAVESQVEDSRGISFVDDVTWIVEGYDVDDVASKLERCARTSLD